MRLATAEDSYLWCCMACHQVIYDRNTEGYWRYLRMHRRQAKEPELNT
jgi:hypothetical protein